MPIQEFVEVPSIDTFEVISELWKARARLACHQAYAAEATDNVQIRVAPTKGVVANEDANAKEIKLVPMTTSIILVKDADQPAQSSLPTMSGVFKHPSTGASYGLAFATPKLAVETPKVAKEGTYKGVWKPVLFGPAYWLVQGTRDKAEANMASATVKVTIAVDGQQAKLSVPLLQNVKPIGKGEELLVYRPRQIDREAANEVATPSEGSKGGKRAGSASSKAAAKRLKR